MLYDQSLYETHIVSRIWPFSLPWMTLKGQIKVIEFFINEACYDSS